MTLVSQRNFAGGYGGAPLLQLVLAANAANHALFAGPCLPLVVAELERLCDRAGHSVVDGLSEAGQRLAGALMFVRPGTEPWKPGAERVLLLDAVVAGLDGVATAAHHVRRMGATTVDACVVQLIAAEVRPPGIRELYVLERGDAHEAATLAA